jgi:hypothetical protein
LANDKDKKEKKNQSFTLSTTLKNNPHSSFCICGLSKSGRTTFAASFPEPLWLDFDHGLETVSDVDDPMIAFKMKDRTYKIAMKIFRQLKNDGHVTDSEGETFKPKTLIVDTGSSLCYHLEAEVKKYEPEGAKPRPGSGDGLYLGDYNIIQTRLHNLILMTKELPMNVIWIFNIEKHTDPLLGGLNESPAVTGQKMSTGIPHFFNEVYYFFIGKKDNKYKMKFVPLEKFPYAGTKTKGRLKGKYPEGVIVDPTWDKIKSCFGSKKKTKATNKSSK